MKPYELTIHAAANEIRTGHLSPVDLVDSCLQRLQAVEPNIASFTYVAAERARASAERAAQEISRGLYRGPLHGIPFGCKDIFDVAGVTVTSGSRTRADYVPATTSPTVEKLEAAGMVYIGQTNTHEFAYGGLTAPTRNPWNIEHLPGGSSGGSAAAVAAGICPMALGTDTSGSIRIPSAISGAVGLKPTYGRVSRVGYTPSSWSLDVAGPITRDVRDAGLVLQAIAGLDAADPASVDRPVPDFTAEIERPLRGLRIGVPDNFFFDHVSPEVGDAVHGAIDLLAQMPGVHLKRVEIPYANLILGTEMTIHMAESTAYQQDVLRKKAALYGDDVRTLLEAGEFVYATDYIRAQRVRTLMQQAWRSMMESVDVVIGPTVAVPAPKNGTVAATTTWPDGTVESITSTFIRLTSVGNLIGFPALALPAGFTSDGLPVSMQIFGRPFEESTVLRVGWTYQCLSDTVGRIAPAGLTK